MIGNSMGGLLVQFLVLGPMHSWFGSKKLGIMGYKPNRNDLDYLTQLFEEGKMIPVIDKCFSLSEVAEAFRYFGSGEVKGKIVISIQHAFVAEL